MAKPLGSKARWTFLLLAGTLSLHAQLLHPKAPLPSFEVATIKPWQPPPPTAAPPPVKYVPVGQPTAVSDRFGFIGDIRFLIMSAFGVAIGSEDRILGGPAWPRDQSERYQIAATIAPADYAAIQKMPAPQQRDQVAWMQQSLLAERFQLQTHIETRQMPRYALTVDSRGSKLEAAQADTGLMSLAAVAQHVELRAVAVTLDELAQSPFLRIDGRPIVDKTGLTGRFTFTLKFTNAMSSVLPDASDAPDLPTALQEQLGLRLVPETGPVEVLVIDRIERPSAN